MSVPFFLITAPAYSPVLTKWDILRCIAMIVATAALIPTIYRRSTGTKRTALIAFAVLVCLFVCGSILLPVWISDLMVY
ncbi:MAG: hypothetical protein IJ410_01230 [Oscillospiraceae bacterium]|nr:hypothetical protein [Oscillospiraceae bacterium]